MSQKQNNGCFSPIAILIYGVVGLLILSQFGRQAISYLSSTNWQQVPATITSSETETIWETSGERFAGNIVYTYEYDGETYQGDQLNFFGNVYFGNQEDAQQVVQPYSVNMSVLIYVNPNNPEQAVLDRNVTGTVWALIVLGSILTLLSIGLAVRRLL
ncbi:MAG: DUF3592 domain-containing protein [Chloroflexota bacterium]